MSPVGHIKFQVFNVWISIQFEEMFSESIRNLQADFLAFEGASSAPTRKIHVSISSKSAYQRKVLVPFLSTRMCKSYGWWKLRECHYANGDVCRYWPSKQSPRIEIFSNNSEAVHEISFVAIISALGELIDLMDWHRIHALGIQLGSKSGLLLLPSGGGKSVLAAEFMQDPRIKIFSDESPLVRGVEVQAFPLRLAFKGEDISKYGTDARKFSRSVFDSKFLLDFPKNKIAKAGTLNFLILGFRAINGGKPQRMSILKKLWILWIYLVVGWGIPQMREYMLRVSALPTLFIIFLLRFRSMLKVLFLVPGFEMAVGPSEKENVKVLIQFVESLSIDNSISSGVPKET